MTRDLAHRALVSVTATGGHSQSAHEITRFSVEPLARNGDRAFRRFLCGYSGYYGRFWHPAGTGAPREQPIALAIGNAQKTKDEGAFAIANTLHVSRSGLKTT